MNVLSLFQHLPVAVIAGFIAANLIPYLSTLATRAPSWATGALTLALSTANGFFSTWAAQGDAFDWRAAIGAVLVSWLVAALHHWKILKGTAVEARLYAFPPAAPASSPASR